MMKKDEQLCVYCGTRIADTRDHIPPKNLFPKPRPDNLITVPSCSSCNNTNSDDDEYFRLMLVMRREAHNHPAAVESWETAFRGLKRDNKIGLATKIATDMREVEIYSKSGVYLGKESAINIDFPRVRNVLNRTIKGLFYHVTNRPLPANYDIHAFALEGFTDSVHKIPSLLRYVEIGNAQPTNTVGANIFSYKYKFSDDDDSASIWLMEFYNCFPIIGFIATI